MAYTIFKPSRFNFTLPAFLVGMYALIACLTFGCAFNLEHPGEGARFPGDHVITSAGCGVFWPLYWSTRATRSLRPSLP